MKKIIILITGVAVSAPVCVWGDPPFKYQPDWESADNRATFEIALADFNGDGWKITNGERKTGDGQRHVFYLEHFPALTITAVRVNGTPVSRADYCFDARAGWLSLKNAPANGARVEVDYKWSNRLDFFAGNETKSQTDNRDVIYFNRDGAFEKTPSWLSAAREQTWTVAEADFDADGDVDVAIGGHEFIMVYKNAGAGLEGTPSWSTSLPGGRIWGLAWGDLENDGYLELAAADFWKNRFLVFKNNAGTLENTPSWSVDDKDAFDVAWGDVDGDGDMDLAGGTWADIRPPLDGYAYVFKNNAGNLERVHCWRNDPPRGACDGLAWGDVNGDGWLDLVKAIGAAAAEDWYPDIYYSQKGVLPKSPSWESTFSTHCFRSRLADCDLDGHLDLLMANGGCLIGYFTAGGSLERDPSWAYVPGEPFTTYDIRTGDVNGDGYPDVVAGCSCATFYPTGGPNKLFLNKGNIGINVKGFAASRCPRGVALRWEVNEAVAGFNLFRETTSAEAASEPRKVNEELITGRSPYRYLDTAVEAGDTYRYWLEVVPLSGAPERHGPVECTVGVKASFTLAQNAPNPARSVTTFAFSVPAACDATLTVYDIAGRKVATPFTGQAKAGENELAVDVSTLAPGVYTYRLEAGGEAAAKRMVVVR